MKDLLHYLLTQITDFPDDVSVTEADSPDGIITLTAIVNPADMGRVIGKEGRVINAIRSLVKVKAIREGKRIQINLQEPESPTTATG
ncbi:MAG: hypothetical protein A2784_01320 [Candidatus Chisholmbacteria bacterium RIFCSPHIGHO2_01_FULL_48_12]|uniref:RNA-binding protein KhpA n=1 Tax=Candidatus Chisholmbacteria bacterium RIFCSPHIGHO2_01_FULL_48_12 TaxID=1797589 RepID=A0A1G1VLQ6_9BACT|nr:MAG: hypothetical protein A2784_01320 [Candidatus Chisholmbacteria bacterium RIFCSPHIGHO2_01_FULL_48_12]